METTKVKIETLRTIIENETDDSTVFTVNFVKRTTGKERVLNCRRGVKKGVTGVGLRYNPKAYNLLSVFDMQNDGFRMINLETVRWVKLHGRTYEVA